MSNERAVNCQQRVLDYECFVYGVAYPWGTRFELNTKNIIYCWRVSQYNKCSCWTYPMRFEGFGIVCLFVLSLIYQSFHSYSEGWFICFKEKKLYRPLFIRIHCFFFVSLFICLFFFSMTADLQQHIDKSVCS